MLVSPCDTTGALGHVGSSWEPRKGDKEQLELHWHLKRTGQPSKLNRSYDDQTHFLRGAVRLLQTLDSLVLGALVYTCG